MFLKRYVEYTYMCVCVCGGPSKAYSAILSVTIVSQFLFLQDLSESSSSYPQLSNQTAPFCEFTPVTLKGGKCATILLENPVGCPLTPPTNLDSYFCVQP